NAIILDKTGTITEGKPVVTDVAWTVEGAEVKHYKEILYTMEAQSEHPLAEAVVNKLKEEGIAGKTVEHFESMTARGVRASKEGRVYFIGNRKLIEENKIQLSDNSKSVANQLQSEAKTVVYFANETIVLAVIAIADKIKATSKAAI